MSVTVRKLNDDTSFLFTFSTGDNADSCGTPSFRVLLDPWLTGDSTWLHPSFQLSSHIVAPAVTSLRTVQDEIDLIIVSQDKPDHCHKETLCSWPKEKNIAILATPEAAKKIRGWNHFNPKAVHVLPPYDPRDEKSLRTIRAVHGTEELTVANLVSRKDLTGLHNAIAMTYRPNPRNTFVEDKASEEAVLVTPPDSPGLSRSQDLQPQTLRARIKSFSSLRSMTRPRTAITSPPLTPDDSPYVSCIYTPHGVSPSLIEPYLPHLAAVRALPLTLLIHSTTMEKNPWFMGGIVVTGAPGGLKIVQLLEGRVRHWLSAHDGEKDNTGISVKLLKTHKFEKEQVEQLLQDNGYGHIQMASLGSGHEISICG